MLKLSDPVRQERLETIFRQLGWTMTGRSVSERDNSPPMLTYWLTSKTPDPSRVLEIIPGQGYGLAREPELRTRGNRTTLILVVRQLVPTLETAPTGLKEFGDE